MKLNFHNMSLVKNLFQHTISTAFPVLSRLRKKKLILAYHDIARHPDKQATAKAGYTMSSMQIPRACLAGQLSWLSGFADFVSLDTLVGLPDNSGADGKWRVAVTFDDAYKSVLALGLPLLEKYQVPVTVFVPVSFVENRQLLPWWHVVSIISEKWQDRFSVDFGGQSHTYNLRQNSERLRFEMALSRHFYRLSQDEVNSLNSVLTSLAGQRIRLPENSIMDLDELKKLEAVPLVTLGSHTSHHITMGPDVPDSTVINDIGNSIQLLSKWTGNPVAWFAYPYGKASFRTNKTSTILNSLGITHAVTTEPGYVTDTDNPYLLPRLSVDGGWNLVTFKSHVLAADLYGRIQANRSNTLARQGGR